MLRHSSKMRVAAAAIELTTSLAAPTTRVPGFRSGPQLQGQGAEGAVHIADEGIDFS